MRLPRRIHIFGASGSGTTTLASALAARHGHRHLDTDEFFWLPTDPPYREIRPREARLALLRRALGEAPSWVLSGSLCGWGDPLIEEFDLVVFLVVPTEVRLARLRAREVERYGHDAIAPGGPRGHAHVEFLDWAGRYDAGGPEMRSRALHDAWLSALLGPTLRLEGDRPAPEQLARIEAFVEAGPPVEAPALILVDLQAAAFGGHGIPPVHDPDLLLGNVRTLLQAARRSALPVVHIQHCAAPGDVFAEGAPGWPIFPPVGPAGSEPVVRKRAGNAFEGTDLHARLQGIGARTLVVAGLQTEHCVAATCRGALRLGYAVQLAADAHSTWPDEARSAGEIMAAECAALEAEGVTLRSTERLVEWLRASVAVLIERLSELPADRLGPLVAESEQVGLRFVRRLADEWTSGRNRFDRPGEALFAAVVEGRMIGVCGLNVDPYAGAPTVGRVRHLYVLSDHRKVGVGQRLVREVVAAARGPFGMLRLCTENPAAARLYERMGFRRCTDVAACTHLMELR